jgi:hypothetical protein
MAEVAEVEVEKKDKTTKGSIKKTFLDLDEGKGVAMVHCILSKTINTGNYESTKIEVGMDLPCDLDKVNDARKEVERVTDLWLGAAVKRVRGK